MHMKHTHSFSPNLPLSIVCLRVEGSELLMQYVAEKKPGHVDVPLRAKSCRNPSTPGAFRR